MTSPLDLDAFESTEVVQTHWTRRRAVQLALGTGLGVVGVGFLTDGHAEAATEATKVIQLANTHRRNAGRRALGTLAPVSRAALKHSADQAAMQRMTHVGSDGSNAGTRLRREGYVWRAWGENVAAGQPTAAAVVKAWMNSPGHRANILSPNFAHIGVSAGKRNGRVYWTMVLARR